MSSRRKRGWALSRPAIAVYVVVFIASGALAIFFAPAWLLDNWLAGHEPTPEVVRVAFPGATQAVLFVLGGCIAIVGVVVSLSRHALELQQQRADVERELRSRFTNAVTLLGDPDRATSRQSGVYALAALADDWQAFGRLDERQVCIEVLCGYVRSGWDPESASADDERRVRSAVFDVIGMRLRGGDDAPGDWRGARFNFRGARVDYDIAWRFTQFTDGAVDFGGAQFTGGTADFSGAQFTGGTVAFIYAHFTGGTVAFIGAHFTGGTVAFIGAHFTGGTVGYRGAVFKKAELLWDRAVYEGTVDHDGKPFRGFGHPHTDLPPSEPPPPTK